MASVNKVILLGNLGADPEVRYLESGSVVANLRIATTEKYKNREGNLVENTEWHDIELWEGLAKIAEQYLKKGNPVYIEGKIKTDSWTDEQGNNRYRTKIRGTSMQLLGSKSAGDQSYTAPTESNQGTSKPKTSDDPLPESPGQVDDLPF